MATYYDELIDTLNTLNKYPTNGCVFWEHCISSDGYGLVSVNGKKKYVHRLALEYKLNRPIREGCDSSHVCPGGINRDCLNFYHLREAERLATMRHKVLSKRSARYNPPKENTQGKYKGVSRTKNKVNPWKANIRWEAWNYKKIHLGTFPTRELAAMAYDEWAHKQWNTDCYLNFPENFASPHKLTTKSITRKSYELFQVSNLQALSKPQVW